MDNPLVLMFLGWLFLVVWGAACALPTYLIHRRTMSQLAKHAEYMYMLYRQADFKNGVTDASGNHDEGDYLSLVIMDEHRRAWLAAGYDITRAGENG